MRRATARTATICRRPPAERHILFVQPFDRPSSLPPLFQHGVTVDFSAHRRFHPKNLIFSSGNGGSRLIRPAKTSDYVVAICFVPSNHPEAAGAYQFDQPKRLITPSPTVSANQITCLRRRQQFCPIVSPGNGGSRVKRPSFSSKTPIFVLNTSSNKPR